MKFKLVIAIGSIVCSCGNSVSLRSTSSIQTIDENPSFIELHHGDSTTFLSSKLSENLIRELKNSTSAGMYKFISEFNLTIHYFQDDLERNFRVHENLFKEKGDHTYKLRNKDYFENLWQNSDEIGFKKYQSLGNNLYRDSEGTVFHQVIDKTTDFKLVLNDFMRFDTIIGSDTTFYAVKLNQILDLATFKRIEGIEDEHGITHYEDKNNTYFLRPMAEGGLFHGRRKSWE